MTKPLARNRLWLYFTAIVFGVLILSTTVVGMVTYSLMKTNPGGDSRLFALRPLSLFLVFSIVLGSVLALFVTKTILAPVAAFSRVADRVAEGDFSVQVSEKSMIGEVSGLAHNLNTMILKLSYKETLSENFIRDVSHEFNTPLSTIEGYAALLQDHSLPPGEREEYAKAIIRSARQLSALSGNILRLSKLENNTGDLPTSTFRLDEQIRQVLLLLEPQWSAKNLELTLDLPRLTFYGNEQFLGLVWHNLLGNAIKFTPEAGEIRVTIAEAAQSVIVQIADNGCGMDTETQERAFERFFQGDAARHTEGSGLGLALVARIISRCGGEISLDSKIEEGTSFSVSLPLQAHR